jgi:hypothetical protein
VKLVEPVVAECPPDDAGSCAVRVAIWALIESTVELVVCEPVVPDDDVELGVTTVLIRPPPPPPPPPPVVVTVGIEVTLALYVNGVPGVIAEQVTFVPSSLQETVVFVASTRTSPAVTCGVEPCGPPTYGHEVEPPLIVTMKF